MKKLPSKVAHNRPPTFFFNTGPAAQTAQKQKSRTPKSPLMQDWVVRLGPYPICNSGDWTSQLAEFKKPKTCNLLNHANSMECNFNGFCLKNWTQWKLVVHSNQHSECTHGRSTATESQIVHFHETKRYMKRTKESFCYVNVNTSKN